MDPAINRLAMIVGSVIALALGGIGLLFAMFANDLTLIGGSLGLLVLCVFFDVEANHIETLKELKKLNKEG